MIEKEIWRPINFNVYQERWKEFNQIYGKPKLKQRLAFRFGHTSNIKINTRIRITNGEAEIMQKLPLDSNTHGIANEIQINLGNNVEEIYTHFLFFKHITSNTSDRILYLLRFENLVWDQKDFEIKLTHQFGNKDVYSFEVESKNDKVDLMSTCNELKLPVEDLNLSNEFWDNWNKNVNVDVTNWDEKQIKLTIKEYLHSTDNTR